MNANVAQIDLMVLQTEVKGKTWLEAVVHFTNNGVPQEVIMRLESLWDVTKKIGEQVYEIGKILVMKIIEFIIANPGLAIGAVLGVAVGSLTSMIPWVGTIIAPVAMSIGGFFGAVAGHRLDKIAKGELSSYRDSSLFADLITIAQEFWKGLAEIFNALKEHFIK